MRHKLSSLCMVILIAFLLTGCMMNPELKEFHNNLTAFSENYLNILAEMEAINTNTADGQKAFLTQMQRLDKEVKSLADMPVPEEYDYVGPLADKASEEMSFAVSCYTKMIEQEIYNQELLDYAQRYLESSLDNIQQIFSSLTKE